MSASLCKTAAREDHSRTHAKLLQHPLALAAAANECDILAATRRTCWKSDSWLDSDTIAAPMAMLKRNLLN
eukprot:6201265-Pleurochrysis_carterae.AAC.2